VETLVSNAALYEDLSIELSERLYSEEGYHYITNADFSGVLIEEMR
jgi:hypothetical protein